MTVDNRGASTVLAIRATVGLAKRAGLRSGRALSVMVDLSFLLAHLAKRSGGILIKSSSTVLPSYLLLNRRRLLVGNFLAHLLARAA